MAINYFGALPFARNAQFWLRRTKVGLTAESKGVIF